ncbi:uncharacterized protein N0V89_007916 [Didymosphaeria variabile]|uniref:Uncharacterized protein n=1 Tax=Didymosphaeria variabile TaxID=1932322 RepID=A0A9W8XKE7_9PLEO|nr:uncharacterized protein N0V89_007916 [Didymosphaeria variabile]KAJ4352567.1 hypothetical protein N0V89_007916 [Didymosphaeria variabile]
MLQSPVSPESPDGARAFHRIHNYEAGLEVAANQNREKNDLDPVVVNSPVDTQSPLYVTHGRWPEAPQAIDSTSPQAMGDAALETSRAAPAPARHSQDASGAEKASTLGISEKGVPNRWCGLSRKVLLLIILLVLLLVGAIIGGAVGGTLAKKSTSLPALANTTALTQPADQTAPSKTSSSTESTSAPHVRFRLQTYDDYNYAGSLQAFTEPGIWAPAFPILSYTWVPARSGDYLDENLLRCSVAFCANETVIGWRGSSEKQQPGSPESNHTANFLHIACDKLNVNPECRGFGLGSPEAETSAMTAQVFSQMPSGTEGEWGRARRWRPVRRRR